MKNLGITILKQFLILSTVIFIGSCQSPDLDKVSGKTIMIDFRNVENITAEDFLLVDDFLIQHSIHQDDWKNGAISKDEKNKFPGDYIAYAPSSEMHLYEENSGRRLVENNTLFHISTKVGKAIFNFQKDNEPVYQITNGQAYTLGGYLSFKRRDGKEITVKTPKNYQGVVSAIE